MANFGSQCKKYLKQLEKAGADVQRIVNETAEAATLAAIEKAVDYTPPNHAKIAGTNMRTGHMAEAWVKDSIVTPSFGKTELRNNQQYASYVNDGHRMDRHFVPGLIKNGRLLERAAEGDDGGIMVGTKTTYVKGLYIKEKAIRKYRKVARENLKREVENLLK